MAFCCLALLKKANFINVLLAFGAVLVMALDGSRTSMLWLALVWGATAMIAFFARVQTQPVRGHFSLIVVTLLSFSLIQPVLLGWVSGDYDKLLVQLMEKQTSDHPDTANLSISHTRRNFGRAKRNDGRPFGQRRQQYTFANAAHRVAANRR